MNHWVYRYIQPVPNLLLLFFFLLSGSASDAQTPSPIGEYSLKLGNEEQHLIYYELTLDTNGTFTFHSHNSRKKGIPSEEHRYGKGTWSSEIRKKFSTESLDVTFLTDKNQDLDDKYTLNFTGTKARLIAKSPRDKSKEIVKTRLHFFESGIFWIQGVNLFKE